MLKTLISSLLPVILVILSGSTTQVNATTIATFEDPTIGEVCPQPLFTINLFKKQITAGWSDSQTGLNLNILGTTYQDAHFTMPAVTYYGNIFSGLTSGGTIKFFEDNQSTSSTPLIQFDFSSGGITPFGFGAGFFHFNNVAISGSAITDTLKQDALFGFGFSNPTFCPPYCRLTTTAWFTSSAAIPEPATIVLFGIGAFTMLGRKRK